MQVRAGSMTCEFPVAMAEVTHPFPSRTRPLSPPAPLVLRWQLRGRVGGRRSSENARPKQLGRGCYSSRLCVIARGAPVAGTEPRP